MSEDRNDLAWWFPKIEAAGLPVPRTRIVDYTSFGEPGGLMALLDGEMPTHWDEFVALLDTIADEFAPDGPVFLRTGHLSGKHSWMDTCFVTRHPKSIGQHVAALVEESAMADLMGLPTDTWVVREMIETKTLFRVSEWRNFPVTREFRVFIRDDGADEITVHPYWPADSIPSLNHVTGALLEQASLISHDEIGDICTLAGQASGALGGGFWSIDFLQDADGKWWLTDMAEGDRSFKNPELAVLV